MNWFTKLFINEAKNALSCQGGSGGPNIFAKPSTAGDTLTWDGNTDGLESVKMPEGHLVCLVSENVLTLDDCANGMVVTAGEETVKISYAQLREAYNATGFIGIDYVFSAPYDGFNYADMIIFPKAGTYFVAYGEIYTASLTIPGYTGFPVEPVIDTKYLPEHLHFGTEKKKTGMDTLSFVYKAEKEIDLNTFKANKISDSTFTSEECANGISVHFVMSTGTESTATFAAATHPSFPNLPLVTNGRGCFILSIPEGSDAGEAGMYFIHNGQWYDASFDITIPGYTGFVVEQVVVIPMDEAYMPYLTSPSGKKFKLSVDDSGVISATEV